MIILLSSTEATSSLLDPVLGSSVQERHEHIGMSPAKGHKDNEEFGTSLIQEAADRVGSVQPQEEKAHRDFILANK